MITATNQGEPVLLRRLTSADLPRLLSYLEGLGPETRRRFGPHPFTMEALMELYSQPGVYTAWIAENPVSGMVIAYSVVKRGFLEHDRSRLESYGMGPDPNTDCTYAPSVADEWQSKGIGKAMFNLILKELKASGFSRIILWGGVQGRNEKAKRFYLSHGFKKLGEFDYNGPNEDMIREISNLPE